MEELEERLIKIENRIKKLEEKEKRRQIFTIMKTVISILLFLIVIASLIYLYNDITDIISPYQKGAEKYSSIIEEYLK